MVSRVVVSEIRCWTYGASAETAPDEEDGRLEVTLVLVDLD
jgi:hypothetical protein